MSPLPSPTALTPFQTKVCSRPRPILSFLFILPPSLRTNLPNAFLSLPLHFRALPFQIIPPVKGREKKKEKSSWDLIAQLGLSPAPRCVQGGHARKHLSQQKRGEGKDRVSCLLHFPGTICVPPPEEKRKKSHKSSPFCPASRLAPFLFSPRETGGRPTNP